MWSPVKETMPPNIRSGPAAPPPASRVLGMANGGRVPEEDFPPVGTGGMVDGNPDQAAIDEYNRDLEALREAQPELFSPPSPRAVPARGRQRLVGGRLVWEPAPAAADSMSAAEIEARLPPPQYDDGDAAAEPRAKRTRK